MPRWKTSVPLLVALLCGAPLSAQAVRGELVDAESGRPVGGVLVVLLDASGKQVEGAFSDAAGRFLIRAPSVGRYTLRAERIGRESAASPALQLADGETLVHRLVSRARPVALEALVVQGASGARDGKRCDPLPDAGRQTAALWEEARKALNAAAWTERRQPYRVEIFRHDRVLVPSTMVVESERTVRRTGSTTSPFVSVSAERLARHGFVQTMGDSVDYHGPDAQVLLSDAFLATHCFRAEPGTGEDRELAGLAFEPVRGRSVPDVRGTLWLDPKTGELRRLEYTYTGLIMSGPTGQLGGRMDFERLPTGEWIIPRWRIRVPLVEVQAVQAGLISVERKRIGRFKEESGEVVELRDAQGRLVRSNTRAALAGTVWDSTRSVPLAGARVRLAGTSVETSTGPDGRFRLAEVAEGRYTLTFDHPRADSLEFAPEGVEVELRREREGAAQLAIPPLAALLASRCGLVERKAGTGVVAGTVRQEGTKAPPVAVPVILSWAASGDVPAGRVSVLTDYLGHYLACTVPAGVPVVARVGLVADAATEVRASTERASRFDLTLSALAARMTEASPVRLAGTLTDAETKTPVAGAKVRLDGRDGERTTSRDGSFSFDSVPPGVRRVEIAHADYGTRVQQVEIRGVGTAEVRVAIARNEAWLEPLIVTALATEARRTRASPVRRDLMIREDLDRIDAVAVHVGDLLRRFSGVNVTEIYYPGTQTIQEICVTLSRQAGMEHGCSAVVIDNQVIPAGGRELLNLRVRELESVEFVPAIEAQIRYGRRAAAGAIVVFTRARGPHVPRPGSQ
ncbi:MAG TPA: carboxypeptidase regulatory-like domain-containing protein [Longimicrobiaceae bacterium]